MDGGWVTLADLWSCVEPQPGICMPSNHVRPPVGKIISSVLRVGVRGAKLGFLLGQEVERQACQVVKRSG